MKRSSVVIVIPMKWVINGVTAICSLSSNINPNIEKIEIFGNYLKIMRHLSLFFYM